MHEYPYFKDRKHPELITTGPTISWDADKSPKSELEIKEMGKEELVTLLKCFVEDKFAGITKAGLYNAFGNCLKEDYEWALEILKYIQKKVLKDDHPIWNKIIQKFQNQIIQLNNI